MRRALAVLLLLPLLHGCVAYPRVFLAGRKGQAAVEPGHPRILKAAIIRRCEAVEGESEVVKKEKTFKTDDQGRYSFSLTGLVWTWRNFLKGSSCEGRVQLYACQDVCRPVDLVDLELLGR